MRDSTAQRRSKSKIPAQPFWAELPEEELLQLRLKDLDVSIAGTWLEECLRDLNDELKERGIVARAHAWISDEWFSPDNTPGISFPFYLAHPRLKRLERKVMHDVEGGTRRECMRILRHEAGHIVQHAYGLHRRKRWQKLFGRSSTPYPNFYTPNPSSKDYVQHLRRWYGQSHPDEDFAETFAVWLTPHAGWRKQYKNWPALEKLEYVDELMAEIAGAKPGLTKRLKVDPISKLTISLGEHYQKKRQHYSVDAPAPYDRDLRRIFASDPLSRAAPPAAGFIRSHRVEIRNLAFEMTGECHVTLDALLDDMIERCRALKLRAPGAEHKLRNLMAKLTKKIVRALHDSTTRQRFAV